MLLDSCLHVQILTSCLNIWRYVSQFMIAFCMLESCSMFDESSRSKFDQYMLWDVLIKVLDQMRFTSKCSIKCVSHRWFDRKTVLHARTTFSLYNSTRRTNSSSFSSCQCRRDISEIANFCLIWIARDLRQWTNQLDKNVNDFIVVIAWQWTNSDIENRRHCLHQIREYAFAQSSHESDSRIRALSVLLLLYSSTITSDAQSRAKTRSFEHEVFFYWKSFWERNLQKERDHSQN